MQDLPELPDEGEALLDALERLAENLAGSAAVDWDAAASSELNASHKALLPQLRAIAQIASAHERFAREADVPLDPVAAVEPGRAIAATVAPGELRTFGRSKVISEERALARVRHPNVVTVYGADHIGRRKGRTLPQRIAADGPLAAGLRARYGGSAPRAKP